MLSQCRRSLSAKRPPSQSLIRRLCGLNRPSSSLLGAVHPSFRAFSGRSWLLAVGRSHHPSRSGVPTRGDFDVIVHNLLRDRPPSHWCFPPPLLIPSPSPLSAHRPPGQAWLLGLGASSTIPVRLLSPPEESTYADSILSLTICPRKALPVRRACHPPRLTTRVLRFEPCLDALS